MWHQVVLILTLLALTLIHLVAGQWSLGTAVLWWWLGGVVGFVFVFSDRLIHSMVTNPSETLSLQIKDLFKKGRLIQGLSLTLAEREKQQHLVVRSALFLVIYLVLAFFTATSVANAFPRGFVLGIGIHLFFDLFWDFRGRGRDINLWFWQIKRELLAKEIGGFVWVTGAVFGLLALGL